MISSSSSPLLKSPLHFKLSVANPIPSPNRVQFRTPRPSRITASFATASVLPPKLASSSLTSLYEVLGIPTAATGQEIKSAYRRLARSFHPDVVAVDRKDSSSDEFIRIHAAYSTLSDPEKRADYDRRLLQRHRLMRSYSGISASNEPVRSRFSGYTGRNWETDQCW